jgi:hypothetical protein
VVAEESSGARKQLLLDGAYFLVYSEGEGKGKGMRFGRRDFVSSTIPSAGPKASALQGWRRDMQFLPWPLPVSLDAIDLVGVLLGVISFRDACLHISSSIEPAASFCAAGAGFRGAFSNGIFKKMRQAEASSLLLRAASQ